MSTYSDDVLNLLKQFISSDYLDGSDLYIKKNRGDIDSICVSSVATAYRRAVKDVLLLRVKSKGSKPYISFRAKYSKQLNEFGFDTYKTAAENDFVRVSVSDFMSLDFADSNISVQLTALFNKIFAEAMSFDSFGCCSKYIECSNADKCLHEDQLYSTACMYRKNLEAGKNFYKGR